MLAGTRILRLAAGAAIGLAVTAAEPTRGCADGPPPPEVWQPVPLEPRVQSLLVPGWGQLETGRTARGSAFMCGFFGLVAASVVAGVQAAEAYDRYETADTPAKAVRYRRETERYDRYQMWFTGSAGLLWAVNVLDIHFSRGRDDRRMQLVLTWQAHRCGVSSPFSPASC
ncbi:MAG: hypothetical protein HYV63_14280 [Candidatus Schekmanbacteria bacterium]|nr:hypothetical protein [Candidatus Schekmanbacteria bacterium]